MTFQQITDRISSNPKQLFLLDGFGALLSSFLLGVILVEFKNLFGIPVPTLYFLAILPGTFAIYDLYCFTSVKNIGLYLKSLAHINASYCCISLGFAFYHVDTITVLGWIYILLEILIVLVLANLEINIARLISKESKCENEGNSSVIM